MMGVPARDKVQRRRRFSNFCRETGRRLRAVAENTSSSDPPRRQVSSTALCESGIRRVAAFTRPRVSALSRPASDKIRRTI
jgi:hypothetical protein